MTSIDPAGNLSLPRGSSDSLEASCGGDDAEETVPDEESIPESLTALAADDPRQLISRIPDLNRFLISARPFLEKPLRSVSNHTSSPFHTTCTKQHGMDSMTKCAATKYRAPQCTAA